MTSIKTLIPTFLLLIVYFIADVFFGPVIGTIVVAILGIGELLYTLVKEKRFDSSIFFGTIFFIGLGLVSIFLDGGPYENLQHVIIMGAVCLFIGIFAFSKADMTKTLPESYRKSILITEEQQRAMRRMMQFLFYVLVIYTVLVLVSTFYFEEDVQSFINGPLLYILIILFFLTLFVRNKLLAKAASYVEWLPVVNEKGEVIGKATRKACHSGSKLLHPVVHLHIFNHKGDIYLQKRNMNKDIMPGMWDTAVGGHVDLDEKIEDALKREAQEELGINKFKARFLKSYIWESPKERELVFSFMSNSYDNLIPNKEEIQEGRFWTREEIRENLDKNVFTPNFIHEFMTMIK